MQRVSIIGNSGSGKSTLARRLAAALGAPMIELDALYHQPGWSHVPSDVFRRQVGLLAAGERLWLDLPRPVVMGSVMRRTFGRLTTGRELWNGNREHWSNLLRTTPEENIILWAWTMHDSRRRRYQIAMVDPAHDHLHRIRLRSRSEVAALLARIQAERAPGPVTRR